MNGIPDGRYISLPERTKEILCFMRLPPDPNGHGGSQRAWHLLRALQPLGRVHFILLCRPTDVECVSASMAPLAALAESATRIVVEEWRGQHEWRLRVNPLLWTLLRLGSERAPRLPDRSLTRIASRLPITRADMVFAGRVDTCCIVTDLLESRRLSAKLLVTDFDDIVSNYLSRELQTMGRDWGRQGRLLGRLEAGVVRRAERRIAQRWHGISVCTDEDVSRLRKAGPRARLKKVPNVVDRPLLQQRSESAKFSILFVGNLSFTPNVSGLRLFVEQAWSDVKRAVPNAEFTIVGYNPDPDVTDLALKNQLRVVPNASSLEPFYDECDVVIAPILFGSGTRIKILEAMAFGRPVVATGVGAEGMGLKDGRDIILVESIADFGGAIIALERNPELRTMLARNARSHQQDNFTFGALAGALRSLIGESEAEWESRSNGRAHA